MSLDRDKVLEALKKVKDPELDRDIISLGMLKNVSVEGEQVSLALELTSPSPKLQKSIEEQVRNHLAPLSSSIQVNIQFEKAAAQQGAVGGKGQPLAGIQHVVAVASGKGGVGKSTVSVNLALALAQKGYKVGLMDGDIYGPNVPLMLGISPDSRPTVNAEEKIDPIEVQGIKMISMGVMVPPDQPMVWRGPMLHSAVTQFLQKVSWGQLDFLLVDLPPGTGDVQLSLVQSVPLSGAVIVTTPQEVALMDVRKGIAMFHKTQVPILGVVENMAGEMFGEGGGENAAAQLGVTFLGRVPLKVEVREGGDSGHPIVATSPNHESAQALIQAAQKMVTTLERVSNLA